MSLRSTLARAIALAVGVAGCNSILDNNPARLQQEAESPNVQQTPTDPGNSTPPPVTTTTPPPVTTTPVPAPTTPGPEGCGAGKRECGGSCAATTDPNYGCGAESCAPCQVAHATAACAGPKCVVAACAAGFADCNGKPEDGCETDLSKATSCGACNAVCPAATPVCAPEGAGFQCGTGCTPAAPLLCGAECVSPVTSVNHCGGCGLKCPEVPNGTATCEVGQCGFTCNPDFNKCNGTCVVATDPNACGAACTVCPVPANGAATCAAGQCGFTCGEGFANCNNDVLDGCEAALKTDPLNCGGCGLTCGTGTCVDGVCQAPPPDGGAP